jgi:hypothetical protein
MPTDPYVPPDPDARPRQQQNLPPGVALPPASQWRASRPGDLGPAQPEGELFGSPGPNVGFAYTLTEKAASTLQRGPHERLEDVVPVVAELAGRRAARFGRAPVLADVQRASAALGYDGSADPSWVDARTRLVHEAGHSYARRRALVASVPERVLVGSAADLPGAAGEWRAQMVSAPAV